MWFTLRRSTHFHTILFVVLAGLTLQLVGPAVYAMMPTQDDAFEADQQKIKIFQDCVLYKNSDGSCMKQSIPDVMQNLGGEEDFKQWVEIVESEDLDFSDELDSNENEQIQPTLKSQRTLLWWIKFSLILMLCLSGIYLPVVQAVRPWDVNPKLYDICHDQDNGSVVCFRFGRIGIAYDDKKLDADGRCLSEIPGEMFNSGSTCINALDAKKIELCVFTPHDTSASYFCKITLLNGLPSSVYSQDSNGVFIKSGLSNLASTISGHIGSFAGIFTESSSLAKDIQRFKADDGTCLLCMIAFPPTSIFVTVVKEFSQKLGIGQPASLDFSLNKALCDLIKEKSPHLLKLTNEPMKGFIAHVLALHKYQPNKNTLPIVLARYSVKAQVTGGYTCSLFGYCPVVKYPFAVGDSPELIISEQGVDIVERINAQAVADMFASFVTGRPEELARGYALLMNMQPGRSEERMYISPTMKPLDLSNELIITPNPFFVRPTNEIYIVAPLLEQKEEVCRMTRELEDAQNASGGMTNFKVYPSRLFDC